MTSIDPLPLAGRRALVTGGASGIGAATAHRLATEGAVVLVTDLDGPGAAATANAITTTGDGHTDSAPAGMATAAQLDVADAGAWARVVAEHGPFDIGFLNAGVATGEEREPGELPILGLTDAAYRRATGANIDGVVFGARALLPGMVAGGRGDLVATASMAGLVPISMDPVYGLTKHAVVGFVRSLGGAFEQHPADLHISAICPGFTDTNIIGPEAKELITATGLAIMSPDKIAEVVVRAIAERIQGAQWVVWPGQPVEPYAWASPFTPGVMT